MAFKSSILVESSNKTNDSINTLINNENSYMHNLLEFNDKMHQIEISSDCNLYRGLKELSNSDNSLISYNEGIIGDIVGKLANIIQAIIDYIKKVVKTIFGMDNSSKKKFEEVRDDLKAAASNVKHNTEFNNNANQNNNSNNDVKIDLDTIEYWALRPKNKFSIRIYHYPDITNIDDGNVRACVQNIVNELNRVCTNQNAGEGSDKSLQTAYKALYRTIKKYCSENNSNNFQGNVENSATFKEFVKADICFVNEKMIDFDEFLKIFYEKKYYESSIYASKIRELERDLEYAKRVVSKANIQSEEQRKHADNLVHQLQAIVNEYIWFVNFVLKMAKDDSNYLIHLANKILRHLKFKNIYDESSSIHGEEFNSDTLFANNDIRDFGSTEWLDLSLTAECYEMKYNLLEFYKRTALSEALILTDDKPNKFNRLVAMREAQEKSIKDIIKDIFNKIKELFNQFIGKIKNSNIEITKYIQKNKEFISKPVKLTSASSSGDIIAGMYRIQQKLPVVPFNYETMKEDLKDKRVFFEKHILQSLKTPSNYSKRKVEWSNDMSITEYCKAYYGASMPENKYPKCEFNTSELQANMDNIVKFVQTYNGSSFSNDINAIENESRKISTTSTTTQEVKAEHESMYYSSLYNTWFNEIQVDKGETTTQSGDDGNKNSENGENTNKDIDEATAFKNYAQAYNDVFLSKITATEFIANELKSLLIAHAESYMSEEQKKNSRNIQDKPAENK